MVKKKSTLEKMLSKPNGDWKMQDVLKVSKQEGLDHRKASTGSHHTFSSPHSSRIETVPYARPIKAIHIKNFARLAMHHRRCKKEEK